MVSKSKLLFGLVEEGRGQVSCTFGRELPQLARAALGRPEAFDARQLQLEAAGTGFRARLGAAQLPYTSTLTRRAPLARLSDSNTKASHERMANIFAT